MIKGEKAAQALLDELGLDTAPVDVEHIARQLNLVVTKERLGAELSGLLVRQPGAIPVIGVNTLHHPRRQRFTIAHELGHFRLQHKGEVIVDSIRVSRRDDKSRTASERDEREANAFAAALLMPPDLVQQHVQRLMDARSGQTRVIIDLAGLFDVSEESMRYRLLNLGMLSH